MKRIFPALIFCIVTGNVMAANLDQGTHELRLNGLIDFDTANDTLVAFDVAYGYFLIDQWEVGALLSVADDDVSTLYGIGAFTEYFYPLPTAPQLVPFGGLNLSIAGGEVDVGPVDEDETALQFGIDFGADYFITDNLALDARVQFRIATDDIFAEDDDIEDTDWRLVLGLRYFFDL